MWSSKRNIIISISIIVLFVIFIVASLIVGLAAAFIIEKKEFKKIEDEFKQYVHNDNVIYYCNNYIYIGDRAVELANDVYVEWMNDDYILLLDTKQDIYYFIDSWNNIKKIDTKKDNFNYVHSGFYYNSYVYFHHSYEKYCRFSLENDNTEVISEEQYTDARIEMMFGGKYIIDKNKTKIDIINRETNDLIETITKEKIISSNEFSNIQTIKKFRIEHYQIVDDILYIQLFYAHYEIIIKYDIVNKTMNLYDFYKNKDDRNYYDPLYFCYFDDGIPPILNKYYIL